MTRWEDNQEFTITIVARRCGLSPTTVRRYVRRGLVQAPFTEADLARLRRIRRLTDMGINLTGAEIILRMRRQIEELQAELNQFRGMLNP